MDLGTYQDLVYRHDAKRPIDFSLSWTLPTALEIEDVLTEKKFTGSELQFEAGVQGKDDGSRQEITSLRYALGNLDSGGLSVAMLRDGPRNYSFAAQPYQLVRNQGRPWPLVEPYRFYGFPEEVLAFFQNAGFTSDLVLGLEQQLRRIQYLGRSASAHAGRIRGLEWRRRAWVSMGVMRSRQFWRLRGIR